MVLRLRPEARLDLEAAVRWYEAQENGLPRGLSEHPPCPDPALPLRRGLPTHSRTGHHRCAGRSALRPRPQALAKAVKHLSAHAPNPLPHLRAPARLHRETHAHEPRLPTPDAEGAPGPPRSGFGAGMGMVGASSPQVPPPLPPMLPTSSLTVQPLMLMELLPHYQQPCENGKLGSATCRAYEHQQAKELKR